MSEVIARRQFSPGYIGFDIAFCWFLRDCCCGEKSI